MSCIVIAFEIKACRASAETRFTLDLLIPTELHAYTTCPILELESGFNFYVE